MKKLLLLFTVVLTTLSASAYDFEVDGIYYNVISVHDLTCEVTTGYTKYSGDVFIPSSITYSGRTFSVTTIGGSAFSGCSSLTSVVIPNSVTTIGGSAFYKCTSLTSVEIPNSVTTIGSGAFYGCKSLTSVVIPNSVTTIGESAIAYCSSLTSVVIPNSVTTIEGGAFEGCSSLTSVVIPNSITTIGASAFSGCSSLTSVVIPNSVTTIGWFAFQQCTSLTSVVIPNSVTTIEYCAFYKCTSLTSVVIGNSVTTIGREAFRYCSSLKEITSLSVNPPAIESNTFEGVSKTETIVKVPDEAVDAYKAAYVWQSFWNIVGLNGEGGGGEQETKQCEAPEIAIVAGKIVALSATEGSKCYTSITSEDFKGVDTNEPISLSYIYKITSYAHAEGYQNSETVTKMLYLKPTTDGEAEMTIVGDINEDGNVDVNDVVRLVQIILNK